ncbi:hypothetical protein F5Y18DRAFT_89461 [Xylariaceae sp. FL1019]|nr:hypothetical protein F5Y18DRAFT_89461 [Xylariaceae sp. FL1019]
MASSQYGSGSQRYRRRRHTSSSENHDWEPRRDESRHSLPYRARQPEVQRPDGRRPKQPSHRPRVSDDFLVTRPMPPTPRPLTRAATDITRRSSRRYHDDDDESDEQERLRGRLRSKSRGATSTARSRVRTRPSSPNSDTSDSTDVLTPTPSSYPRRSAPPSAPSVPSVDSLSQTSSSDSESSGSSQDQRMQARTLKERMNGAPGPDPEPTPASTARARPSRKSRKPVVHESDSDSDDSSHDGTSRHPRVVVKRTAAAPRSQRQKQRQSRPSVSPSRNHRHHDRRSEGHLSSPSKRYANNQPSSFLTNVGMVPDQPRAIIILISRTLDDPRCQGRERRLVRV